jgi:hypothetical protein
MVKRLNWLLVYLLFSIGIMAQTGDMAVQMGQYNVPVPALPEQEGLPDVRKQNDQNRCRYFLLFSDKYCIFVP